MPADSSTVVTDLRAGKLVRFWFTSAGADGAPVLLMNRKKIPLADIKEAKRTAKDKQTCEGHMRLEGTSLVAYTDDATKASFAKDVRQAVQRLKLKPSAVEVRPQSAVEDAIIDEAADTGPQSLRKEYRGEEDSLAWRADLTPEGDLLGALERVLADDTLRSKLAAAMKMDEAELRKQVQAHAGDAAWLRKVYAATHLMRTKYFTPEEQAKATVTPDAEGRLRDADGNLVHGFRGFVIDEASGDVRTFQHGTTEDPRDGTTLRRHHSSPVAGGDVKAAGNIQAEDGRVTQIDDLSGHYRPDATRTLQGLRHLEQLGVKLMDDRLVDAQGAEVVDQGLQKAGVRLAELEAQLTGQGIDPATVPEYREAVAALERAGVWFSNREAKVELLSKVGISEEDWPAVAGNRAAINALLRKKLGIDHDVLVQGTSSSLLKSRPAVNMTIGQLLSRKLTVEQFRQTGGNEAQIRAKDAMQEELLRTRRPVKPAAKTGATGRGGGSEESAAASGPGGSRPGRQAVSPDAYGAEIPIDEARSARPAPPPGYTDELDPPPARNTVSASYVDDSEVPAVSGSYGDDSGGAAAEAVEEAADEAADEATESEGIELRRSSGGRGSSDASAAYSDPGV